MYINAIRYKLQPETLAELGRLEATASGTVSAAAQRSGYIGGEPLMVIFDALLRYAKAHRKAYESTLSKDYVLGPEWLAAMKGAHGLLDGNGAVAMEQGRSTDSKDNGTLEAIYWRALEAAGFTEADLD